MRAVDEPLDLVCCVSDAEACDRADQCVTRPIWQEASRKIKTYFNTVTIADLCEDARKKGVTKESSHPFEYNI